MNTSYFRFLCIGLLVLAVSFQACKKTPKNEPEPEPPVINPPADQQSGLVVTSVDFPTADAAFNLTFDASRGNAEMQNLSGDVYIYTGVITDKSTSATDWKYVKSPAFNTADPNAKMTALGSNKFQISINPRTFYGVPASEKILKLAMVFKNADGSKVGRNKDRSDIYVPLYDPAVLSVRFRSPEMEPMFTPAPNISVQVVGSELTVSGVASKTANLTLSLNGTPFATAGNATQISGKAKVTGGGSQVVKISATEGASTAESTFTFVVSGTVETAELPAGAKEGVVFINNGQSAVITLYAPNKSNVFLLGDFNNWQAESKYFMKRTPDGNRWWIQVDNLTPGTAYC